MARELAASLALSLSVGFVCVPMHAQQTGAVASTTPGSAIGRKLPSVQVPVAKPSCISPAASSATSSELPKIPDLIFSRDDLICVRHKDGSTQELPHGVPWGVYSASGDQVAYWGGAQKHELHVFSLVSHTDEVIDTASRAMGPVWSAKGHVLAYVPGNANPPGIRIVDVDTGKRIVAPGAFTGIFASPARAYVGAMSFDGIERVNLIDGQRELVVPAKYLQNAAYSPDGTFIGIQASEPSALLALTPDKWPKPPAASDQDEEPDCGGGASYLILWNAATKRLTDVPFPKGFDSIVEFEFSPDGHAIAVTFGSSTSCDYPGDEARVFVVSLPDLNLTPVSPASRLCAQPHWSPDGNVIIYGDFNGPFPLIAVDVHTGKMTTVVNRNVNGPDTFLGWR